MEESPREKIAFCPALRSERDVWVLRPDFWYSRRERSYLQVGGGVSEGEEMRGEVKRLLKRW